MSRADRSRLPAKVEAVWIYLATALLAEAIFLIDINLPLGIAGGIPYITLVLIAFWAPNIRYIYLMAIVGTLLTLLGFFLSPSGGEFWIVVTNRLLATIAVWITAILAIKARESLDRTMTDKDRFQSLIRTAPSIILLIGLKHQIIDFNTTAESVYGKSREEVLGKNYLKLFIPPDQQQAVADDIKKVLAGTPTTNFENLITASEGCEKAISWNVDRYLDSKGNPEGVIAIGLDVTDRNELEIKLKDKSERLELASSGTNDGLWLWNIENNHEWHAPQWKKLLGYDEDEKLPEKYETWESKIHPEDRERVLKLLNQHLEQGAVYDCEHRLRTKSGEYRWFRDRGMAVRDEEGRAVRMGGSIQDITDLKEAEAELARTNMELERLSLQDGLTGIANRRMFDQFLKSELARAHRSGQPLSMILIDVDFFKNYNDHYGHIAGDECLKLIARTLAEVARRPADLVARYGGEEFVLLLPETDTDHAIYLAEECCNNLVEQKIPHAKSKAADVVTISAGIGTIKSSSKISGIELIEIADKALYKAKKGGRNRIVCCQL